MTSDIPTKGFTPHLPKADFSVQEAMIPMRDGVKLCTIIVKKNTVAKGPILLTRTPYGSASAVERTKSRLITEILPRPDADFVSDGYIRVYQDVRGKHGSEGEFLLARPLRGPLNSTETDESTDAYDTIDWLIKNIGESNGCVGIIGSSYGGFTSLMALINPHPALKAAAPEHPLVDGWMGDDWFHYGAFRQLFSFQYIARQTADRGNGPTLPSCNFGDAYSGYLNSGASGHFAKEYGLDELPFVKKLLSHPAYDEFWQAQALDKVLAREPFRVPTMLIAAQWDQEDHYGAPAVYDALRAKPQATGKLFLVLGPWRHSGINADEIALGPLEFPSGTAREFRRDVMKPFFDRFLRDGAATCGLDPIITYATGLDRWSHRRELPSRFVPLYLRENFTLSFDKPPPGEGADSYVSDPNKPVPFAPRPFQLRDKSHWQQWLIRDQRFVDGRPDVLSYVTETLLGTVHVLGRPVVDLKAATSGTDSDWVVKLIDVYPDENSCQPQLAGYQLPVGIEIFRGRYNDSFEEPRRVVPGKMRPYRFSLPFVDHAFLPGHRLMVQIQSSLFPLYDRNPQTFVANIFFAQPDQYQRATQTIFRSAESPSALLLPVVE